MQTDERCERALGLGACEAPISPATLSFSRHAVSNLSVYINVMYFSFCSNVMSLDRHSVDIVRYGTLNSFTSFRI